MKEFNVTVVVGKESEFGGQDFAEFNIPLLLIDKPDDLSLYLTSVDVASTWAANSFDPDMLGCLRKQLRKVAKIDISECTSEQEALDVVVNHEDFDAIYEYTFDLTITAIK